MVHPYHVILFGSKNKNVILTDKQPIQISRELCLGKKKLKPNDDILEMTKLQKTENISGSNGLQRAGGQKGSGCSYFLFFNLF